MAYRGNYFKMGDWNAICDMCGGKFKASELKEDWRGFMMCARDWEPRHPQDFVMGVSETMNPPWIRPRQAPHFVNADAVNIGPGPLPPPPPPPPAPPPIGGGGTPTLANALAGEAIAGEAIAGDTSGAPSMAGESLAGVGIA